MTLEPPPYLDPAAFQRRARLLADLGTIEWGRKFGALVREMVFAMAATYGVMGTVRALRNVNLVQRRLLPEIASLDLFKKPPRVAIPVHFVFGEQDVLNPASIVKDFPALIAAPTSTVVRVPNAGHMVHFDQPAIVRTIAGNA
jgi:pimeloyl-ACP methyl ester carboxylesterase